MLDQQTRERMLKARRMHKARGGAIGMFNREVLMSPLSKHRRSRGAARGAAVCRAKGDVTFNAILEQASVGASLREAMDALGLSESGIRMCLARRLGSGSWPPKINSGENSNGL